MAVQYACPMSPPSPTRWRMFGRGVSQTGNPAVLLVVYRQPGANIIATVDRVLALLPLFRASIPPTIKLSVVLNATTTIRASVRDVQITLLISIGLVILVVFLFLRSVR